MKSWNNPVGLFVLLALILLAAILLSLFTGSSQLTMAEVWRQWRSGETTETAYRIFLYARLPRTIAALAAGAALAVSGALVQAVLNNALASPGTIGVNSGAGFFALLAGSFLPQMPYVMPIAAFLGALGASLVVYGVAVKTGASRISLILAGVAISRLFSAGIDTLTIVYPDEIIGSAGFMVGSFSGVTLQMMYPALLLIGVGLLLSLIFSYDLNILALGDTTAAALGMCVAQSRFGFLLLSALLAGAAVSFSGLVGFIGLMVPHICRKLFGAEYRRLIPCSAMVGASFALLCDVLGKLLFAPFEVPVGIVLAFLGCPFFLFLLFQKGRSRIHE